MPDVQGELTPTPPPVVAGEASPGRAPRVQPSSHPRRARVVAASLAAGAAVAMAALWGAVAGPVWPSVAVLPDRPSSERFDARSLSSLVRAGTADAGLTPAPAESRSLGAEPVQASADREIEREGRGRVAGGVLFVPKSFASADGTYDLLLHFHGNTAVVLESAEVADLNAIVAVVNLGVGSAPYEEAYEMPGTYEQLLAQIDGAVAQRGLRQPRLRRVALSSWSAGYGAISTILKRRRDVDPLDAVLVLDGIHVGWEPSEEPEIDRGERALDVRNLAPFIQLAKKAAADELLFSITHADVDPKLYAGASQTASYLLQEVGGERLPRYANERPSVGLRSAVGAIPKKDEKQLELTSEARVSGLHVRGFSGESPEHHMAHLLEMGQTVLPELAQRWSR